MQVTQLAGATGETFGPVPGYRVVRVERSTPGLPLQVLAVREGPGGFQQTCTLEAARVVATGGDPELVRALLIEAGLASRIRHPSVAVVHDVLEHDGWLMLVMPFEGNLTLSHVTAALGRHTRRLDESIVWHIAHTLFDTLDEAHHARDPQGKPIVHGDLRPGNIVVRGDGGLVVRGFGGSRATYWPAGEAGRRGLYECPMRLEGSAASVGSDLYAAAAIVWELLVDAPVAARYHAPGALLNSSDERALPSLALLRPDIPHSAAATIDLCLSMDPDARTCTASSVANIIHRSTDALAGREKLARLHGNVFARMGHPRSRWATEPSRPGGVDCDAPTERVAKSEVLLESDLGEDDCDTVRVVRSPSGLDGAFAEPWESMDDDETTAVVLEPPAPPPIMSFPPVANNIGSEYPPANASAVRTRSRLSTAAIAAAVVAVGVSVVVARGWRPGEASSASVARRLSQGVTLNQRVEEPARPAPPASAIPTAPAIAVWRSRLVVHGPPEGVVFVQGKPLGRTGEAIDAPCGMRNVRVGTQPRGGVMETVQWLSPGQAVMLPCGWAVERRASP